jgi:hypothetical protein
MVWTEEMRQKAAATRAANKLKKEARLAKKQKREEHHQDRAGVDVAPQSVRPESGIPEGNGKPWFLPTHAEWQEMELETVHALVQKIQACYQEGAAVLNQRKSDQSRAEGTYVCVVCRKKKPQVIDNHPNYVWRDDRPDPQTRIYVTRMICSQECFFRGSNAGSLTSAGSVFSPEKSSPKGAVAR